MFRGRLVPFVFFALSVTALAQSNPVFFRSKWT